jgi:DNA-binding LacI/PurR family transcriptional regulator
LQEKRTIYTIAKELGLAPSTVSKIINNKGSIHAKTRARVLEYIKEVGYVPTSSARRLKSKKSYTVGVVFTEEADVGLEHSFFSSILQNFKFHLESRGYELSFIVKKLGQHEMSYLEWCYNKQVDGVYIVVGNYSDKGLIELIESDIPCVSTDMELPGLTSVIGDNDQGIKLIVDFIKNTLKKNKVQMITGPQSSKAFVDRLVKFIEYAKKEDLNLNKEQIIVAESFGFSSGYQACQKLIDMNGLPDVLVVASDDLALGVLKALRDHQIKVPDQVQVIGYDDIEFAKHFTPPLTTIRQDRKLLGETAAKALIEKMNDQSELKDEVIKIPVELIIRDSTKI